MQLMFPRGFSSNLVLLTWSVFGGVLLHGLLANFRVMLIKPILEEQVDTAKDILDRKLIPVMAEGGLGQYWIAHLKQSPNLVYQQLAKIAVVPEDMDELITILKEDLHGAGTHVYLSNWLWPEQEMLGSYHWSKEVLEGNSPWIVWIVNKKWPHNDDLGKHILMYQQVCRK